MARVIAAVVWLTLVWVALWEDLSPGTVTAGVLVALVALATVRPVREQPSSLRVRPVAALRFFGYFVWKLVEASVVVAWEVVTPRNRVREGIIAVELGGSSDIVTTIVANALSLTPGTLTIDVRREPMVLYVHVLHLRDIEEVRREVLQLETLARRAFEPSRAAGDTEPDNLDAAQPSQATRHAVGAKELS